MTSWRARSAPATPVTTTPTDRHGPVDSVQAPVRSRRGPNPDRPPLRMPLMFFRWDWLRSVLTAPIVPTLGPVHPHALTVDLASSSRTSRPVPAPTPAARSARSPTGRPPCRRPSFRSPRPWRALVWPSFTPRCRPAGAARSSLPPSKTASWARSASWRYAPMPSDALSSCPSTSPSCPGRGSWDWAACCGGPRCTGASPTALPTNSSRPRSAAPPTGCVRPED